MIFYSHIGAMLCFNLDSSPRPHHSMYCVTYHLVFHFGGFSLNNIMVEADDTTLSSSGLVDAAALTNHELFTSVVAVVQRSVHYSGNNKNKKKRNGNIDRGDDSERDGKKDYWRQVAITVATSVVKGENGYQNQDDWVRKFHSLLLDSHSNERIPTLSTDFGEALRSLDMGHCYRMRLTNALEVADQTKVCLTVKQAAGLIRCSALLLDATGGSGDVGDVKLRARAMHKLFRSMPNIMTNPYDIFLAVQSPLLQKLGWSALSNGGLRFSSLDSFAKAESSSDAAHASKKRKRDYDIVDDNAGTTLSSRRSTLYYLLEAAALARRGAVRAQHGAVIYIPSTDEDGETKTIGRGWNHDYILDPSTSKKNKIVLHSEVHAVADAIYNYGEDECFDNLFPRATIMIVELDSDYAYDVCHPCPKCDPMLRAVGIPTVLHTTSNGKIKELDIKPVNTTLLANECVSIPLSAACHEKMIVCKRLQQKSKHCHSIMNHHYREGPAKPGKS